MSVYQEMMNSKANPIVSRIRKNILKIMQNKMDSETSDISLMMDIQAQTLIDQDSKKCLKKSKAAMLSQS